MGRPKDLEKRDAILDAGQALFAAHGLEATTIEAIAEAAGVSKGTVYRNFNDKVAILGAIIDRGDIAFDLTLLEQLDAGSSLATRLEAFGVVFLMLLNEPQIRALDRVVAIEGNNHPDIARKFFKSGPGRLRNRLVGLLQQARSDNLITCPNPERLAEHLLALWLGFDPMGRRFILAKKAPRGQIEKHVRETVDLFLRGVSI